MQTRIITKNGICRAQVLYKPKITFVIAYYWILFIPCGIIALLANFRKNIKEMFFTGEWLDLPVTPKFQTFIHRFHPRCIPGTEKYYRCMVNYYKRTGWPEIEA